MKLVRNTFLSLAALTAILIALFTGCSGSDPLSTTVGNLVLEFQVTDTGSTEYEESNFLVYRLVVRPASEENRESMGGAGISLLTNEIFEFDLNTVSSPLPPANLPAGLFLLEEVSFFPTGLVPLTLVNNDIPDPEAACIDQIMILPETELERGVVARGFNGLSLDQRTFRPDQPIMISSGGIVNHQIQINSAMLIQAYKNAFTCSDSDYICTRYAGKPAPCIWGVFDAGGFITELEGLDWISYGPE